MLRVDTTPQMEVRERLYVSNCREHNTVVLAAGCADDVHTLQVRDQLRCA